MIHLLGNSLIDARNLCHQALPPGFAIGLCHQGSTCLARIVVAVAVQSANRPHPHRCAAAQFTAAALRLSQQFDVSTENENRRSLRCTSSQAFREPGISLQKPFSLAASQTSCTAPRRCRKHIRFLAWGKRYAYHAPMKSGCCRDEACYGVRRIHSIIR